MTAKSLMYVTDKYPAALLVESEVTYIHYILDKKSKFFAISPSGPRVAHTKAGPMMKLTKNQAVQMAREILELLEDNHDSK